MRILFAAVALVACATFTSASDEPVDIGKPIVVGEPLPDMRLPRAGGWSTPFDSISLTRQRAMLIEFASW